MTTPPSLRDVDAQLYELAARELDERLAKLPGHLLPVELARAGAGLHGRNRASRELVLTLLNDLWLRAYGAERFVPEESERISPNDLKVMTLAVLTLCQQGRKDAWNARARHAAVEIGLDRYDLQWSVMQLAIIALGWEL